MKKIILTLAFLLTLSFLSCRKEEVQPTPIINLLIDEQPSALVDSLGSVFFDNPLITDVTATTDAVIQDYPLFLDYDPFTTISVRTNSIDSCVKGIEITKAQKEQLTKAWNVKIDCEKTNKEIIARIHREIETWAKNEKASLYAKYLKTKDSLTADFKSKVAYVNEKYNKGLITLEQKNKSLTEIETKYHNDLAALEKSYKASLGLLSSKVKEKIKTNLGRAEACGKIKDCEKNWLLAALDILGKDKYKKWIECYKFKYRKK